MTAGRAPLAACIGETMGQFVAQDSAVADARSFRLDCAGAESNVAIGLARLGFPSLWVSRVGDDPIGTQICESLEAEGVDTAVRRDPHHPTGVFIKYPSDVVRRVIYYRTGSAASYLDRTDVDRALEARPQLIHVSGITPALSESCDAAIEYALRRAASQGVVTSFDVNYRPQLWPDRAGAAERLLALAELSDIVFVGRDEARDLWGADDADAVVRRLAHGRQVVVKDGSVGAGCISGDDVTFVPALRFPVVETVGAGDAFAAGWLGGYLGGRRQQARLRMGHLLAREALRSTSDHGGSLPPDLVQSLTCDEELWRAEPSVDAMAPR